MSARAVSALRWAAAALAGIALVVALTLGTLQLTDQHVGLGGEPPSAGRGLAPAVTAAPAATTPRTTPTTTTAPTTTSAGDGEGDGGEDD
jgi:hypothetical protein